MLHVVHQILTQGQGLDRQNSPSVPSNPSSPETKRAQNIDDTYGWYETLPHIQVSLLPVTGPLNNPFSTYIFIYMQSYHRVGISVHRIK